MAPVHSSCRPLYRCLLFACALASVQCSFASSAEASKSGLLGDEATGGFSLGVLGAAGVLLTYGIVGVDYDGLLVPPTLGWVQLGVSTASFIAVAAAYGEGNLATISITTAASLLALHAIVSIVGYKEKESARSALPSGWALLPDPRGSIELAWREFF